MNTSSKGGREVNFSNIGKLCFLWVCVFIFDLSVAITWTDLSVHYLQFCIMMYRLGFVNYLELKALTSNLHLESHFLSTHLFNIENWKNPLRHQGFWPEHKQIDIWRHQNLLLLVHKGYSHYKQFKIMFIVKFSTVGPWLSQDLRQH